MRFSWRKYGIPALTGLLILSCASCRRTDTQPENLLPIERMADILQAIYLAEVQAVRQYDLKLRKDEYIRDYLYPEIFRRMDVPDSVFYYSYRWYEDRPARLEALLDSVLIRLEAVPLDSALSPAGDRRLDERFGDIREAEDLLRRQRQSGAASPY